MFTHLHLHTQYSLLEGAIKIPELTSALQQKGFDACAITDHGNMYGAMEFYHAMKKAGLKPLIGMGIFSPETDSLLNTKDDFDFKTSKFLFFN